MAEAFVADLASGLLRKIVSVAAEELIQAWGLEENLQSLTERLEPWLMLCYISDAESKQISIKPFQVWLNKLKAVAHVADVLMEDLQYEVLRRKVEDRKVRDFFSPSRNNILYRFKVARKIKYIDTSFNKITNGLERLELGR